MSAEEKQHKGLMQNLDILEEQHPYWFSFIIALLISSYIIFFTPSFIGPSRDEDLVESLDVINIEEIRTQKRTVSKQIDINQLNNENADIDRAQGTNEEANAKDLDFLPGVVPPRPIGNVKKYYPKILRENEVEAAVYTQVLVLKSGKVLKVKVTGVKLLKAFPKKTESEFKLLFRKAVTRSLKETSFTPPVVKGVNVPVWVRYNLVYKLND